MMSEPDGPETQRRAHARRVAAIYFVAAAIWIVLSDIALLGLSGDFSIAAGGSIAKGLLFCAVTALILYVALTRPHGLAAGHAEPLPPGAGAGRFPRLGPAAVFGGMALLLAGLAAGMFMLEARREDGEARDSLTAILELKAQQLELWLDSHRRIARSYAGARALREQLARLGSDAAVRPELEARLESIRNAIEVDAVLILDRDGRLAAGAGEAAYLHVSEPLAANARATIGTGHEMPPFLHRNGAGGNAEILIDFVVALRDMAGGAATGALVLRERAHRDLFELVQRWPTPSETAEAVLVRHEGDDVVFLNDLRFRKDAALNYRRKIADTALPAARALSADHMQAVDGVDYRGVEVVASARRIAGSDWALITKIDRDEVLEPVRRSAGIWLAAILAITLLGSFGVGALWRERMKLAALRERSGAVERKALEEHLGLLSRHANDIILLLDSDGRIVEANDRAVERYGYGRERLSGMPVSELRAADERHAVAGRVAEVLQGKNLIYEARQVTAAGQVFPVEISTRRVDVGGVGYIQAIIRDISERKRALSALEESESRFRAVLEQSIAGIYVIQDGKVVYVNPRLREIFGYRPDEPFDPDPLAHIVAEERQRVAQQIALRMADDEPASYSIESLRRDGVRFTLGVNARRAMFGGRPAIIAMAQDITEKARVESERLQQLSRYHAQQEAMGEVSMSEALVGGRVEELARQITEIACRTTGVERANVWLFNDEETELSCVDLYEASPGLHSAGGVLTQAQFGNEFAALKTAAYVNADEPLTDARTIGYANSFLRPLGITSMLDAVVRLSGRHLGLLCLEHVGRAHHWEHDEIAFACQLADKIAIAIANQSRRHAKENLERTNRALKTLSAGNTAMVHADDEPDLLGKMCRAIVGAGAYRVALVAYAADGPGSAVALKASQGLDEADVAALTAAWARPEGRKTMVGMALATGNSHLARDVASNPRFEAQRGTMTKLGLTSIAAFPLRLKAGDPPFGVLSIGATEADAFDNTELALLGELAGDLSFGVVSQRTRVERLAAAGKVRRSLEASIQAIAATVEMRDPYTAGHEKRVAALAAAIAREMGLPEFTVEGIHFGALIHDLGKIQVPAEILSKPTRLSAIEYELIKQHPQAGYDILKGIEFPWPVARIVHEHHERLDGSGYPQGLKGDAILPEARVLAVADTVEAMSSHRPYRPGLGIDKALAEIERGRGTIYDTQVADACLRLFREKNYQLPA